MLSRLRLGKVFSQAQSIDAGTIPLTEGDSAVYKIRNKEVMSAIMTKKPRLQSGTRTRRSSDPYWSSVGRRLVDLRKGKGWYGYQVAQMIDVDPATISQIENGKRPSGPERETLERLAGLFGVSLDFLLGKTEPTHAHGEISKPPAGHTLAIPDSAIRAAVETVIADFVTAIGAALTEWSAAHLAREAGSARSAEPAPTQRLGTTNR
jgi:transcriptional regulator with XRE-family HTH domain